MDMDSALPHLGPSARDYQLDFEWMHLTYNENAGFAETYGFAGNQGMVNVEGIRIFPCGVASDTLLIYLHPASTLQLCHMQQRSRARTCFRFDIDRPNVKEHMAFGQGIHSCIGNIIVRTTVPN